VKDLYDELINAEGLILKPYYNKLTGKLEYLNPHIIRDLNGAYLEVSQLELVGNGKLLIKCEDA